MYHELKTLKWFQLGWGMVIHAEVWHLTVFYMHDNTFLHWCSKPDQAEIKKQNTVVLFEQNSHPGEFSSSRDWGWRSHTSYMHAYIPCMWRVMTYLSQAGFVPKYGQKLSALKGVFGYLQLQRRSSHSHQECGTEFFGTFSLLEILWEGEVWRDRNGALLVKQEVPAKWHPVQIKAGCDDPCCKSSTQVAKVKMEKLTSSQQPGPQRKLN